MKNKKFIILGVVVLAIVIVIACLCLKSCNQTGDEDKKPGQNQQESVVDKKDPLDTEETTEGTTEPEVYNEDVADWSEATTESNTSNKKPSNKDKNTSTNTNANTNQNEEIDPDEKGKTYTITYVLDYEQATISSTKQEVTYGEEFILLKPSVPADDDYTFVKWVITDTTTEFTNGTYNVKGDVSLTAVWEMAYTKNY